MLDVVSDKKIPRDIRYKALVAIQGLDRWNGYRTIRAPLEELAKDTTDPLHAVIKAKIEDIHTDKPSIIMELQTDNE